MSEEENKYLAEFRKNEHDANKQQIGGSGILIVKKIMSQCAYDRINRKNILVLRKKFDK